MDTARFGTAVIDEDTGRQLIRLAGSRVAVFSDDLNAWDTSTVAASNRTLLHSELENVMGHVLTLGGYDATAIGIDYCPALSSSSITKQAINCLNAVAKFPTPSDQESYEPLHHDLAPKKEAADEQKAKNHDQQQSSYKQRNQRCVAIRDRKSVV